MRPLEKHQLKEGKAAVSFKITIMIKIQIPIESLFRSPGFLPEFLFMILNQ
jgi:hypothetical protein